MSLPEVHLWTDGSGTTAGNPGGWAFVLTCNGHEREGFGGAVDATNNRMELTAVLRGFQALKRPCRVMVYTDSEYVANPFRQHWLDTWQRKQWRKVKNVDLWQQILKAVAPHDTTFSWVRGHTGIGHNPRCDKLAGQARRDIIDALARDAIHELTFEVDCPVTLPQLELA